VPRLACVCQGVSLVGVLVLFVCGIVLVLSLLLLCAGVLALLRLVFACVVVVRASVVLLRRTYRWCGCPPASFASFPIVSLIMCILLVQVPCSYMHSQWCCSCSGGVRAILFVHVRCLCNVLASAVTHCRVVVLVCSRIATRCAVSLTLGISVYFLHWASNAVQLAFFLCRPVDARSARLRYSFISPSSLLFVSIVDVVLRLPPE
jgi:hypothetical protein